MSYQCENLRQQEKCALGCLYRDDQLCCWFCGKREDCPSCCNRSLGEGKGEEREIFYNRGPLSEVLITEINKRSAEIDSLKQGRIIFTIEDGEFQRGEIKCSWGKERRKKDFLME